MCCPAVWVSLPMELNVIGPHLSACLSVSLSVLCLSVSGCLTVCLSHWVWWVTSRRCTFVSVFTDGLTWCYLCSLVSEWLRQTRSVKQFVVFIENWFRRLVCLIYCWSTSRTRALSPTPNIDNCWWENQLGVLFKLLFSTKRTVWSSVKMIKHQTFINVRLPAQLRLRLSKVLRLHQHNIGYMAYGFYRSDDPTNSVKALKEGG